MLNPDYPAPRPEIIPLFDNWHEADMPRLHWYDRPGGGWTPGSALGRTIREVTVHWTEGNTDAHLPEPAYAHLLGTIAQYHAFVRDWDVQVPGLQGGDGIMYHYAIAPAGYIYHVTAETHRTWNAYEANAYNLAVVMMAGPRDRVTTAATDALHALLDWLTRGRADLPLVGVRPTVVHLPDSVGGAVAYQSYGVCTHDESLVRNGRPPKGCCGGYAPVVRAWRALAP